jgi:hypothetical protein
MFEEIRREYEFGVGTIKGVARKLNVHRRMVREAIANATPPMRKTIEQRRSRGSACQQPDSTSRRCPDPRQIRRSYGPSGRMICYRVSS